MRILSSIKFKKYWNLDVDKVEILYFFASKGLDVHAIDSSNVAIENLRIKAKAMNLDIKLKNILQ